MEILTFFLILLIVMIIFLFFYLISNKPNNPNLNNNYKPNSNPSSYFNNNSSLSSYQLNGNEDELLENVQGYENELMVTNNLKEGSYEDQFQEIDFSRIPPPNTEITFNPIPHDRSEIRIPYANINVNCL
jgi:uncharacterized protein YxeA